MLDNSLLSNCLPIKEFELSVTIFLYISKAGILCDKVWTCRRTGAATIDASRITASIRLDVISSRCRKVNLMI